LPSFLRVDARRNIAIDYQRRLIRRQGRGLHYSASPDFVPTHAADINRLRRASPREITKTQVESAKFG